MIAGPMLRNARPDSAASVTRLFGETATAGLSDDFAAGFAGGVCGVGFCATREDDNATRMTARPNDIFLTMYSWIEPGEGEKILHGSQVLRVPKVLEVLGVRC
jgi:hypothetical protein